MVEWHDNDQNITEARQLTVCRYCSAAWILERDPDTGFASPREPTDKENADLGAVIKSAQEGFTQTRRAAKMLDMDLDEFTELYERTFGSYPKPTKAAGNA